MTHQDLADLFQGAEHFLLRRKLAKFIKEQNNEADDVIEVGESLRLQLNRVEFSLYSDSGLIRCNGEGRIDKDTKDRCVRAIISNMITACQEHNLNRFPTSQELEDMAIAMCRRFPVLGDDISVNEDKPWEGFLYKLKRRLANKKPVLKPQGPTPKKARKQSIVTDNASPVPTELEQSFCEENDDAITDTAEEVDNSQEYDAKVMAEHYEKLKEKMNEKKPNDRVIKQLLDMEFPARRQYVVTIGNKKDVIRKVLEPYPCFLKAVHIVDELRRYIDPKNNDYLIQCGGRMDKAFDDLYLYGIRLDIISPGRNKVAKEISVLMNLMKMFPTKKTNTQGLLTVLETEDTHAVINRKEPTISQTPKNLLVSADGHVFGVFKPDSWMMAILALLGIHYTFLLPYPKGAESAMTFLQTEILLDKPHRQDLTKDFKVHLKRFHDFLG